MEGRRSQQTRMENGKKACSLKHTTFETKYSTLAARAAEIKNQPLRTLAHLIDNEWLQESWRRLRKGAAVGVDAINANAYAEDLSNNLQKLLLNFKTKRYQPPPVRRVYIPKADGKQRPLGIPIVTS